MKNLSSAHKKNSFILTQAVIIAIFQDDVFKFVNRAVCRKLGWSFEDLTSPTFNPMERLIPDKFRTLLKENMAKKLKGINIPPYEIKLKKQDGSEFPVMVRNEMIFYLGKPAFGSLSIDLTECKRLQKALRDVEKKFSTLFEHAGDAIIIHDFEGHFIEVNMELSKKLGYSRDELVQMKIQEIHTTEHAAFIPEQIEKLRKYGNVVFESAHRAKNGTVIPVEINACILEFPEKPLALSIIRDISKRKRAEEALKKISDEQKILLSKMPGMVFWTNKKGKFIRVNKAFAKTLNKEPEDIIGRSLFDLYPENQAKKFFDDNLKIMESTIPKMQIEEIVETPSGIIWVSTDKIPYKNENDEICGIIGFSINITEQKHGETQIRKSKALLQSAFDGISEPLIMLDREYSVKILNKAAMKYYQISDFKEVINRTCFKAFMGKKTPCKECNILPAVQSGREMVFEQKSIIYPDRFEEIVVYPHKESKATLNGAIIRITNITEKKKIDEQLIRADRLSSLGQVQGQVVKQAGLRNPRGVPFF